MERSMMLKQSLECNLALLKGKLGVPESGPMAAEFRDLCRELSRIFAHTVKVVKAKEERLESLRLCGSSPAILTALENYIGYELARLTRMARRRIVEFACSHHHYGFRAVFQVAA